MAIALVTVVVAAGAVAGGVLAGGVVVEAAGVLLLEEQAAAKDRAAAKVTRPLTVRVVGEPGLDMLCPLGVVEVSSTGGTYGGLVRFGRVSLRLPCRG